MQGLIVHSEAIKTIVAARLENEASNSIIGVEFMIGMHDAFMLIAGQLIEDGPLFHSMMDTTSELIRDAIQAGAEQAIRETGQEPRFDFSDN